MDQAELDIVVPVYDAGANVVRTLQSLQAHVRTPYRVLIYYDRRDDDTLPAIQSVPENARFVTLVKNDGKGTHGPVMSGLRRSSSPYVLVYMADDDFNAPVVDGRVQKAHAGADIVCTSRFMPGGCMVGCPWLKAFLVRGESQPADLGAISTRDAINGFRLFSRRVISEIAVESSQGFTYSFDLTAKAHRLRWTIVEVPAQWFERQAGTSRFEVLGWMPAYLRWYRYALATTWPRRGPATVPIAGSG